MLKKGFKINGIIMRYQFPISVPYSYAYRLQLSVFETEKHKCPTCVITFNFATENKYLSPKLSIAGYYRKCYQFAQFTNIPTGKIG